MEAFERIVKKHFTNGADIHTAFGRAIKESPDAYCRYLKEDALSDAQDTAAGIPAGARRSGGSHGI